MAERKRTWLKCRMRKPEDISGLEEMDTVIALQRRLQARGAP